MIKPVLKYPGSKWRIASWIISHMPAHRSYVEPFFGSGSILLQKPRSGAELVNDLDGRVVAFFRVLRDRPDELAAALELTPYVRDEVLLAQGRDGDGDASDLEKARRLAVMCWQTRGGDLHRRVPAWRPDVVGDRTHTHARAWSSVPERLAEAAARLQGVAIENRPALEVIAMAGRSRRDEDVLIYADPPYLGRLNRDGRTAQQMRLYRHEMTLSAHAELLDLLDRHPGPVLLSGYPSELYTDRLSHWAALERQARTQTNRGRTEVLWLNPAASRQTSLPLGLEVPA